MSIWFHRFSIARVLKGLPTISGWLRTHVPEHET